jgi:hypothetical protein
LNRSEVSLSRRCAYTLAIRIDVMLCYYMEQD